MLYHFESAAYTSMGVANVVFVLFGVGMIITFICEALDAKRFFHLNELLAMVFALLGLWMIFLAEGGTLENFTHLKGLVNAILAGIGYALFLFFTRKLKLGFWVNSSLCFAFYRKFVFEYSFVWSKFKS